MANLEQELRQALIADPTLSALLDSRVYWPQLPQSPVYPCCAFQRVSTQGYPVHGPGLGIPKPGVYWSRISFTVWSSSDDAATELNAVVQAIIGALNHFNPADVPQSPLATDAAPHVFLGLRTGIEPNTQPPLQKAILDVKTFYTDQ